jgi:hypothetical protein
MNSSKKARNTSSIVNQPSGGGSKKAGLAYMVGRSSWSSVAFKLHHIDSLINLQTIRGKTPHMNLPIGFNNHIRMR